MADYNQLITQDYAIFVQKSTNPPGSLFRWGLRSTASTFFTELSTTDVEKPFTAATPAHAQAMGGADSGASCSVQGVVEAAADFTYRRGTADVGDRSGVLSGQSLAECVTPRTARRAGCSGIFAHWPNAHGGRGRHAGGELSWERWQRGRYANGKLKII